MSKYFIIDLSTICAGLSHQTVNFKKIIEFCYINNLKLIKPIFKLDGKHNNGNEIITDMSKYYDLENILVNGEQFILYENSSILHGVNKNNILPQNRMKNNIYKTIRGDTIYNVIKKNYKNGLLYNDELFNINKFINVNMPYTHEIKNIANHIVSKLGNKFMCIHVRRGDRILNEQMDEDTKPENIFKVIQKQTNINIIYIMTNKIDEIKSLKNLLINTNYILYFYTDFEILKNVEDNYYLYCIECEIMNNAYTKCYTFRNGNEQYLTDYIIT